MSEYEINERRNWKAEVFPYDYYLPDESKECLYCLTEKQAEILRGIIVPLAWRTRWWTNEVEPIDKDLIEQFRDDLIGRLMMGCCGDEIPVQYRYTSEGVLQISTDGGLTWEDAPEYDYRNNSTVWPNPNDTGFDVSKCAGADGVVATFRDMINEQVADDMGIAAITGVIVGVLLFLLSAGTAAAITVQVAALAAAIFSAGVAAWKAAFTSDVWHDFRCAVFDAMNSDLSIDATGITNLENAINSDFTGIVVPTLLGYVRAAGVVGLTNMMRSNVGDVDANCDDCEECEGCSTLDWVVAPPADGGNGVIVEEERLCDTLVVSALVAGGDGRYYAQVFSGGGSMDGCIITALEYTGSAVDFVVAWDLVGETQGTFAHTGAAPVDIVGANVCSVMTRNISPNTTTIHT